jgi:glutathione S-transferase
MLQLVIGNKNYSSWSMRPWVLMRQFGMAFDEIKLRFDRLTYSPDSAFYRALAQYTPVAKVPVLLIDGFAVWDTLAIAEALADRHPELAQPVRRDACRLRCAAQPLPNEHRSLAARGGRARAG